MKPLLLEITNAAIMTAIALPIVLLSVGAAALGDAIGEYWLPCFLWLLGSVGIYTTLFGWWLRRNARNRRLDLARLITVSALIAICLVFGFAFFYSHGGLIDPTGAVDRSAHTCGYFSIITWTSVGYGDVRPTPAMHYVAGIEAVCGYVWMALLVAIMSQAFVSPVVTFLQRRPD